VATMEARLSQPFDGVNRLTTPLARRVISLEAPSIVVAAMKKSGADDLDTESISEPLEILCRSLQREANLHTLGRIGARTQLTGMLVTRARLAQLVTTRPAILDVDVDDPIVITGLPRTGTTLLQRLIACDPGIRSLPYWEAMSPLPTSRLDDPAAPTDDRRRRAAQSVRLLDRAAPGMRAIHEIDPDAPDEEIWLLAVEFASMFFESAWHVPGFAEWYDSADLTDGYKRLRELMCALSFYRPADRWVLKSPQHLERLPELASAFPRAVHVQMHRDPATAITSTASMIAYGRRMGTRSVDPTQIGKYWSWRAHRLIERNLAQRDQLGSAVHDVDYHELVCNPIATVRHLYSKIGRPFSDEARDAMMRHLSARPRHHFGPHDYEPADFGLDARQIRRDFSAYIDRFDVPIDT
jgi:hypothetical protein